MSRWVTVCKTDKTGDQRQSPGSIAAQLTSRKKRLPMMPRPASNQSITGSAYSCIDAVKITRVYQAETFAATSAMRSQMSQRRADLAQEIIHKGTLVNVVGGTFAAEHDFDGVAITKGASPKSLKAKETRGRMREVGEGSRGGVD